MAEQKVLPGLELVGRGIYLRSHKSYELKSLIFAQNAGGKDVGITATKKTYLVPSGYEVNSSPPMPENRSLNHVVIEDSSNKFSKTASFDANTAVCTSIFNIDANMNQNSCFSSEEDGYYATRNTFIPLFAVYIPDITTLDDSVFELDIPTPFDYSSSSREAYDRFFKRYGTHLVQRVWVGGEASFVGTIAKSSGMTKEDIKKGINACFGKADKFGISTEDQKNVEKLQSNTEWVISGIGGDKLILANLNMKNREDYDKWLQSIYDDPQTIELEVTGIWNLIKDEEKSKALWKAYIKATTFKPINGIFETGGVIHFIRGNKSFEFDIKKGTRTDTRLITEVWANVDVTKLKDFNWIDAVLDGKGVVSKEGKDLSNKYMVFSVNKYVIIDNETSEIEEGYPKLISDGWPTMPFERIDAALNVGNNVLYFFSGNQYVKYDTKENKIFDGYPDIINKRWAGVPFERIDTAIYFENGKVLFFSGDQYVRYDMVTYNADPGYPRFIPSSYVEDWKMF